MRFQSDLGLLVLRLGASGMMLMHGWGKLSAFSTLMHDFPDPIGVGSTVSLVLAVFAEFFCSIALAIGVQSRWVTIPLVVTMLVAVVIIHGNDPFHKKELAALYLVGFVTLFLTGPGKYSFDGLLSKRL